MLKDLPPWQAVCQQTRSWLAAGVFAHLINDLSQIARLARDCERLQSTLEGFQNVAFALLALNATLPILAVI